MANMGKKSGVYHVRFRFNGKEYKKSLGIRIAGEAEAALHRVEVTLYRIKTGQLAIAAGVDPGDFIVSGGMLTEARCVAAVSKPALPTTNDLIDQYKESQKNRCAESYLYSQVMHLRHLAAFLEDVADAPCDQVDFRALDRYLQSRLAIRQPNTAERERISLMQFYKWVVAQGHLAVSPGAGLAPIKGGVDRPPFRTVNEVNRIIQRGGLTNEEILDLWECLYLSPDDIGSLLATVRKNAKEDVSFFLHAIPAYTGMRRGEVLRLKWIDIDLDEGFITARSRKQSRTKSETARRIDLHVELKAELIAWRQQRPKGQHVICDARTLEPLTLDRANRFFWQPMNDTEWCLDKKRHWYKVGFHTYRHSFASNLASKGVDQRVIDEFMGHKTDAMRRRYRHLFPQDRRSAIECFSLRSGS
jgi:integrase